LVELRESLELNTSNLAKILDIKRTTLIGYEKGDFPPSTEFLLKLRNAYDVNIDWVLTGFGEKFLSKDNRPSLEKNLIVTGIESLVEDRVAKLERDIMSRLANIEDKLIKPQALESAAKPTFEYPTESRSHESYTFEPEPDYSTIPYGEDVAAGPPIQHPDFPYLVVKVPPRYVKTKPLDYFAFHVKGNSMMDANIPDGCMVMIHRSDIPVHNRIQVVEIDEGITIKRMVESEDHGWTLRHEDGTEQTVPLGEVNQVLGDFVVVLPPATRPFELNEGQDSSEGD